MFKVKSTLDTNYKIEFINENNINDVKLSEKVLIAEDKQSSKKVERVIINFNSHILKREANITQTGTFYFMDADRTRDIKAFKEFLNHHHDFIPRYVKGVQVGWVNMRNVKSIRASEDYKRVIFNFASTSIDQESLQGFSDNIYSTFETKAEFNEYLELISSH